MGGGGGSTLEETPAFAAAAVCFVLVFFSVLVDYIIHLIGHWLKSRNKIKLYEALEKIKSEFMLLGFMSLLLTISPKSIAKICIKANVAQSWSPCKITKPDHDERNLLSNPGSSFRHDFPRRTLVGDSDDEDRMFCKEGKVQFMSQKALHELHIFIFVLACAHVLSCVLTMALGKVKMNHWQEWEKESTTVEYLSSHVSVHKNVLLCHLIPPDPERLRYIKETSFGRRHMTGHWSSNPVLLRILCFFRQFSSSVPKVDYLTLRHGFIMAHLTPQHQANFNFHNYIDRSLAEDFKVVVGISPTIWFVAVFSLLFTKYDFYRSFWIPTIPVVILLVVGTKLQVIIAKMALRIHETSEVVVGMPIVHLEDDLFWFKSPRLLLFLINFVLFQNAFQLAFYVYTWSMFGIKSCFHKGIADSVIIICMGFIVIILCSYVTLPLYALVTQMGSTMKPTIFSEKVANALQSWYGKAKKKRNNNDRTTSRFNLLPLHIGEESQILSGHNFIDEEENIEKDDRALHRTPSSSNRLQTLQDVVDNVGSREIGLVDLTIERSASEHYVSKDFSFARRTRSSV